MEWNSGYEAPNCTVCECVYKHECCDESSTSGRNQAADPFNINIFLGGRLFMLIASHVRVCGLNICGKISGFDIVCRVDVEVQ